MTQPFLAFIMPISTGYPDQGLPGGQPGVGIPGFPTHPIAPGGGGSPPGIWPGLPGQGLPGQPPGIWPGQPGHRPDQGLPGGGMRPDQGLPGGGWGGGPSVSLPIVIPPNGIEEGSPEQPIVLPPPGDMTKPVPVPPEAGGGSPEQPIYLPPLVPSHPIAGRPQANYALVWVPGVGSAWLYIGGKPDQGLPGGGESGGSPDQGLPPTPTPEPQSRRR